MRWRERKGRREGDGRGGKERERGGKVREGRGRWKRRCERRKPTMKGVVEAGLLFSDEIKGGVRLEESSGGERNGLGGVKYM